MLRSGLLTAAVVCCVASVGAVEIFPVAELRPGQQATVWTVFEGYDADSFLVEVLDVVPGSRAGGDVILVRALDERVWHTGIAQGMSGSPVIADGRLIGALAFAFAFASEPIAGVTPFAEMADALSGEFAAAAAGAPEELLGMGGWWGRGEPALLSGLVRAQRAARTAGRAVG